MWRIYLQGLQNGILKTFQQIVSKGFPREWTMEKECFYRKLSENVARLNGTFQVFDELVRRRKIQLGDKMEPN